jgi:hypothetical protein
MEWLDGMRHHAIWQRIALLATLFYMVWSGPDALAAEANPMRAPQDVSSSAPSPEVTASSEPLSTSVFDHLLRFYQQVISEVDGARSNMYPTGSDYARRVIKKHGVMRGIVLTAERLLHEGNEKQVAPRIRKYGIWRTYDPVEANDWWWHGSENWVYEPRIR